MHSFDVVIIGAGPSGCAAAFDLCTAGLSVALLDKSEFPRVKACAGGLTIKSLKALRYSVESQVQRECDQLSASLRLEQRRLLQAPGTLVAMTERPKLDAFCLDRTVQQGAAFHKIGTITGIVRENQQWIVQTRNTQFSGRWLIGADGANSRVRQLLFSQNPVRFGMAAEVLVPVSDPENYQMEFDFGYVPRGYAWVFPKGNHLNIGIYSLNQFPIKERVRAYAKERLNIELDQRIFGHRIPYFGHRWQPYREDAMLVGDAAGLIDPLLGEGIYNAIRSGQIAAAAVITASHRGKNKFPQAIREVQRDLASYWRATELFYKHLDHGYQAMTTPFFAKMLTKGFAMGWRAIDIKHKGLFLPLHTYQPFQIPTDFDGDRLR